MPVTWTDSTSGNQLLQGDNSARVNLGVGTPSNSLSVNGSSVFNSSGKLTANTVDSASLIRFAGAITVAAAGTASVSGLPVAGLGSIDQGGLIVAFTIGSGFAIANPNQTTSKTFNYSVM
jgi:hypothetical protein